MSYGPVVGDRYHRVVYTENVLNMPYESSYNDTKKNYGPAMGRCHTGECEVRQI